MRLSGESEARKSLSACIFGHYHRILVRTLLFGSQPSPRPPRFFASPLRGIRSSITKLPAGSNYEPLRNVFLDVLILSVRQLVQVAVENYFAIAQDQKTHGHLAVLAGR